MVETIAGRYVLLGDGARSGGQSTIRKASDSHDGAIVAVKLLTGASDDILSRVFARETATLAALDHPNIIQLRDSGIGEDGTPYLVLDWVQQSLADVLASGPYSWEGMAEALALPLLSALAYAHLKEVEHRDIKPGNVLIRENGTPLLADFGIAKLRADLSSSDWTVADFRSVPYAPPERDTSIPYVRDVYSIGVLFLQALASNRLREFVDIEPALEGAQLPPKMRALLARCIDPDRANRPKNGAVLLAEFKAAQESAQASKATVPTVHLQLTQAATRSIAELFDLPDHAEAASVFLRDIGNDAFAEFRINRETGRFDPATVSLIGEACAYILKLDSSRPVMSVVSAREFDYENLEAMRRRAMPLRRLLSWSCSSVRDGRRAQHAIETLSRLLEDHEDGKRDSRGHGDSDSLGSDGWFEGWIRLLQAQEEIARGDLQKLRYSKVERNGREADFRLTDKQDLDLVGNEMAVVIEESGKTVVRGEVVDQNENGLTLRSTRIIPSLPRRGVLSPHLGAAQAALQRQRDAVTAVKDGTTPRPDLGALVLDPSSARAPDAIEIQTWQRELDGSKKAAVTAAIGMKDFLVVEGPPGTGKTTFITETVAQTLSRNPGARILIVSQTHVAVDNAIERLDQAGISGVVRLGAADDARVDPRVKHLLLDQQMPKWAASLRRKAEAHFSDQANVAGVATDHLRAALDLQEIIGLSTKMDANERRIEALLDEGDSRTSDAEELARLEEELEHLNLSREKCLKAAEVHLAGDLTLNSNLDRDDAIHAVEALLGSGATSKGLLEILTLQAEWLQRVASDANLATAFLQTRKVIAGTCVGFLRHPAVRDLDIDLCILDEASKATTTEALVPMARSKSWILIGDTKQLPPMDEEVLRRPELMVEYDLNEDFVRHTLFDHLVEELPEHSRVLLDEQYRMIRPIGDLISSCFYQGKLHSPRTDGIRGYERFGKPVLWIDTRPLGSQRYESSEAGGKSFVNRSEARLVVDRLRVLDGAIQRGLLEPPESRLDALLIAPYRRQVEELKLRLSSIQLANIDVDVQTVDSVQGREADVAIFSVTRSNLSGKLGFLGEDYWRRINVALSRARFGLTVVGDAEFCSTSPGALRQVYRYMKDHSDDCEVRECDDA
jgi:serine/threonine protein kinase